MTSAMQEAMRGRRVLEIACGTGVSTNDISQTAEHVLATDIAPNSIKIANEKFGLPNV